VLFAAGRARDPAVQTASLRQRGPLTMLGPVHRPRTTADVGAEVLAGGHSGRDHEPLVRVIKDRHRRRDRHPFESTPADGLSERLGESPRPVRPDYRRRATIAFVRWRSSRSCDPFGDQAHTRPQVMLAAGVGLQTPRCCSAKNAGTHFGPILAHRSRRGRQQAAAPSGPRCPASAYVRTTRSAATKAAATASPLSPTRSRDAGFRSARRGVTGCTAGAGAQQARCGPSPALRVPAAPAAIFLRTSLRPLDRKSNSGRYRRPPWRRPLRGLHLIA
jgi:hypothetical protein